MVEYCENTDTCRHFFLMKYFEAIEHSFKPNLQEICPDKNCDICKFPEKVRQSVWKHRNNEPDEISDKTKRPCSPSTHPSTKFSGFQRASDLNKNSKPKFKKNDLRSFLPKENSPRLHASLKKPLG